MDHRSCNLSGAYSSHSSLDSRTAQRHAISAERNATLTVIAVDCYNNTERGKCEETNTNLDKKNIQANKYDWLFHFKGEITTSQNYIIYCRDLDESGVKGSSSSGPNAEHNEHVLR